MNQGPKYPDLMQEIKERLYVIEDVLSGRTGLQRPLAHEFCFLQLRLICECISFACVIAHEYIEELQAPKIQKMWSADTLMKVLDGLHPGFYPKPHKVTNKNGGLHLDEINVPYLTKDDLKQLNGICGDNLHRGSPEKYTYNQTPERIAEYRKTIIEFSNKVFRLMESHLMRKRDEPRYIICSFQERGAPVEVFFAGPSGDIVAASNS